MFLLIDRVGALCCVSLVVSLSYASDLKITERVTTRGFRTTSTRYITGLRSRYESRSATTFPAWHGGPLVFSYGHRVATIYQCDVRRILYLDLDSREGISREIDNQGRPVNPRQTPMSFEPLGGTLTVNVDEIDTGEREVVFGHTARHIIRKEKYVPGPGAVSQAQEIERDGWYIDLDVPQGCPWWDRRPQGVAVSFLVGAVGTMTRRDTVEVHHTGVRELGFPVELTITSSAEAVPPNSNRKLQPSSKMKVTELSTASVDPTVFELPSGFKQVPELRDQPPPPPSSKVLRVWAWVKQSSSENVSLEFAFAAHRPVQESNRFGATPLRLPPARTRLAQFQR